MKHLTWILTTALTGVALATGCGSGGRADTSKLEQSFQSAGPAVRGEINQAVPAIRAGDYTKAMPVLQKVIKGGGLTDEQKEGISSAIVEMQMVVSQNPKKYSLETYHALSDLVTLLEGGQPIPRTRSQ
ncbi:MAG: hypothetical protein HY735_12290 [Verrucomicrobia bacterium]|nr:hypothetical protein [Verrucomicrobiota bacterium]